MRTLAFIFLALTCSVCGDVGATNCYFLMGTSDSWQYQEHVEQIQSYGGRIVHAFPPNEFGSKKDRHEHLGKGEIGIEAFRNIVNDKRLKKIPMILETPKGDELLEDIENLKILRSLVKK